MKKALVLVFTLAIGSAAPAMAWGGDGDCPYSKSESTQEKTEQVEESDK